MAFMTNAGWLSRFISPSGSLVYRKLLLMCLMGICLATDAAAGVLPKDSAEQYELTFWESIKDSRHADDYEAYLQAYPKGRFVSLARSHIERLRANAAKSAPGGEDQRAPASERPATASPPRQSGRHGRAGTAEKQAEPPAPAMPEAAIADSQPGVGPGVPATVTEVRDCATCPPLIALPRGGFTMGSNSDDPSERPAFHVSIGTPFAIGKYEVTNAQWLACMAGGGCPQVTIDASRPPNTPARDISWEDAQLYLRWLSKQTGKSYRLPTEAEWEYAARGGTTTRYWWGEQMMTGKANCKECGDPWTPESPASVGSFAPNPFGLSDMNGSVWEWVSDCWHGSYQRAPSDGRSWEEPDCRVRVLRGGSWREGASYMPSSTRFKYDAGVRQSQNGFRVARSVE